VGAGHGPRADAGAWRDVGAGRRADADTSAGRGSDSGPDVGARRLTYAAPDHDGRTHCCADVDSRTKRDADSCSRRSDRHGDARTEPDMGAW
jgi:hypothetical protein